MVYIRCVTLKEKKNIHAVFSMYLFTGICLPQCSFFFLADFLTLGKALANFFASKCSILDVAGVLNPLQYTPTWIAYTNNLIQVPGKR